MTQVTLRTPTQISLLVKKQTFRLKPTGRIYSVVDHTVSIYDKRKQYVICETQGQMAAFDYFKLVYPR